MPANRKCFHRGSLIEICFRTERDLPLVCTAYMRVILESILARAQTLYPLTIVAFVVMGNHPHIMAVVKEPADVSRFKEYVKRESAHAINRLLGKINHTVWVDGADDPPILDPEKALQRLTYIYTNPQKAGLEDRIEKYPNLNSWSALLAGGEVIKTKRIHRNAIPALPNAALSFEAQQALADELLASSDEEFELVIEPDAWIGCFRDLYKASPEKLRQEVVKRVRAEERELDRKRRHPVIGSHALRLQSIRKPYTPKKRGKRMLCFSSERSVRVAYISWRKQRQRDASELYDRWRDGEQEIELPPGMFWPGGRLSCPCEVDLNDFRADF